MLPLKKRFCLRFLFLGIAYFFTFVILLTITCIQWINSYKSKSLILAIIFTVFTIVIFVFALKELIPYFKDWKYIKTGEFLIIAGKVEGYKVINYNSDPPTTEKFPIVRSTTNNETITLNVENTEEGMKYKFLYLPNTKLAVIMEEEIK